MQLLKMCAAHRGHGAVRLVEVGHEQAADTELAVYENQDSRPFLPVGDTWREYYEGCAANARYFGIEVLPYDPKWNEFQLHSAVSEIDVRCEEARTAMIKPTQI